MARFSIRSRCLKCNSEYGDRNPFGARPRNSSPEPVRLRAAHGDPHGSAIGSTIRGTRARTAQGHGHPRQLHKAALLDLMAYDLDLFNELQREGRAKRAAKPKPPAPSYGKPALVARGEGRARDLLRKFAIEADDLNDARVLEIGCGNGEVISGLAAVFGSRCHGVDVQRYKMWEELASERVT